MLLLLLRRRMLDPSQADRKHCAWARLNFAWSGHSLSHLRDLFAWLHFDNLSFGCWLFAELYTSLKRCDASLSTMPLRLWYLVTGAYLLSVYTALFTYSSASRPMYDWRAKTMSGAHQCDFQQTTRGWPYSVTCGLEQTASQSVSQSVRMAPPPVNTMCTVYRISWISCSAQVALKMLLLRILLLSRKDYHYYLVYSASQWPRKRLCAVAWAAIDRMLTHAKFVASNWLWPQNGSIVSFGCWQS